MNRGGGEVRGWRGGEDKEWRGGQGGEDKEWRGGQGGEGLEGRGGEGGEGVEGITSFVRFGQIYGLDRSSARKRQTYAITYALECKALNLIRGLEGSDLTWKI